MLEKWNAPTYAMEKKLLLELRRNYKDAYDVLVKELAFFVNKYGDDIGKLSPAKMAKFGRLDSMVKQMDAEIIKLNQMTDKHIKNYLIDIWDFNYYHSAFTLETEAQRKLAYGLINRQAVIEATERPMLTIALKDKSQSVRVGLQRAVTQITLQGLSVQEGAKMVKSVLDISGKRATTIVRTETTGIMNSARDEALKHAERQGLELKKYWIATLDKRTRDRHRDIDGETKKVGELFSNGLEYPGDSRGSAEEVIMCRCSMGTDIGLERGERRTGKDVIPYTTYKEWYAERVAK
jgi:SPP1 gp7 family putative phage head morphogenesis protein